MNNISASEKMEINNLLSLFVDQMINENNWEDISQKIIFLLEPLSLTIGKTRWELSKSNSNSFSGFTPDHGNIIINEEEEEELDMSEDPAHRIGHFRVSINSCWISFSTFWKSSILTSGEEGFILPETHVIFFDSETLQPKSYGIENMKTTLHLNLFLFTYKKFQCYTNILFGDQRYSKILIGRGRIRTP